MKPIIPTQTTDWNFAMVFFYARGSFKNTVNSKIPIKIRQLFAIKSDSIHQISSWIYKVTHKTPILKRNFEILRILKRLRKIQQILPNQSWSSTRHSRCCCCSGIGLFPSISFIFNECSQPIKIRCMQFDIVMSCARYPKWFNWWRTVFVNGYTVRKIDHLQKKKPMANKIFLMLLRKQK